MLLEGNKPRSTMFSVENLAISSRVDNASSETCGKPVVSISPVAAVVQMHATDFPYTLDLKGQYPVQMAHMYESLSPVFASSTPKRKRDDESETEPICKSPSLSPGISEDEHREGPSPTPSGKFLILTEN